MNPKPCLRKAALPLLLCISSVALNGVLSQTCFTASRASDFREVSKDVRTFNEKIWGNCNWTEMFDEGREPDSLCDYGTMGENNDIFLHVNGCRMPGYDSDRELLERDCDDIGGKLCNYTLNATVVLSSGKTFYDLDECLLRCEPKVCTDEDTLESWETDPFLVEDEDNPSREATVVMNCNDGTGYRWTINDQDILHDPDMRGDSGNNGDEDEGSGEPTGAPIDVDENDDTDDETDESQCTSAYSSDSFEGVRTEIDSINEDVLRRCNFTEILESQTASTEECSYGVGEEVDVFLHVDGCEMPEYDSKRSIVATECSDMSGKLCTITFNETGVIDGITYSSETDCLLECLPTVCSDEVILDAYRESAHFEEVEGRESREAFIYIQCDDGTGYTWSQDSATTLHNLDLEGGEEVSGKNTEDKDPKDGGSPFRFPGNRRVNAEAKPPALRGKPAVTAPLVMFKAQHASLDPHGKDFLNAVVKRLHHDD